MRWIVSHRVLQFIKPAKTSRDVLTERDSWILQLADSTGNVSGEGEVAPLWGLSLETKEEVISELNRIVQEENWESTSSNISSVTFSRP